MTTQAPNIYPENVRPYDSDEIDLRRYLLVLIKWWREILAISIVAGATAAIAILLLNSFEIPVYEASADLIIARFSSTIQLDDRVETSLDSTQSDANVWRASLLQLVNNGDVVAAVVNELGDELPENLRSVDALVSVVEASVPTSSDDRFFSNIIRITARTGDPEVSMKMANSWARHLVDYINDLYGAVPETTIASVTAERDEAFTTYQESQRELETFIGDSQIDTLMRQKQEKTGLRGELMVNSSQMISAVVSSEYNARLNLFNSLVNAPYAARLNLYNTLVNAPAAHAAALIATQSEGNAEALAHLYTVRTLAMSQLDQARNMERSLIEGGEAAAKSNVAALRLLKLTAFSSFEGDVNVPLSVPSEESEMTLEEQLTDVRALIGVLEEYVTQLENDITQLAEAPMLGAENANITGVETGLGSPELIAATMTYTNATQAYEHLLAPSGIFEEMAVDGAPIVNGHEALINQLESEIRTLQAKIAAEEATLQELTHERDLAWTTYETVGSKLQELSLLQSAANSEVRIGNPALLPSAPQASMSPVLPSLALAGVGLILGAMLALLIDTLGGSPFFARRSTSPVAQQR